MKTPSPHVLLFLGCPKNSEMEMHLRQSKLWQEAKLTGTNTLTESYFNRTEYIGSQYASSHISLQELQKLESDILDRLRIYCPNLAVDQLELTLFPLILIG